MGRLIVKMLPLPEVLAKEIFPPNDSIIDFAIDSPNPRPGVFQEGWTLR